LKLFTLSVQGSHCRHKVAANASGINEVLKKGEYEAQMFVKKNATNR